MSRSKSFIFFFSLFAFLIELGNPSTRFVRSGAKRQDFIFLYKVVPDTSCLDCHKTKAKEHKKVPTFPDRAQSATNKVIHTFDTLLSSSPYWSAFAQGARDGYFKSIDPPPIV